MSTHARSILYLGKSYPIDVGNHKEIKIQEKFLFPQGLLFRIEKELYVWYTKQAREKITQRVEYYSKIMSAEYLTLTFSDTRSQWGSCSPENNLQFSWRLIMAPLSVLDYVVIHELAHTKEKNHTWKFWSVVKRITPAYKQHMKWLKVHANELVI